MTDIVYDRFLSGVYKGHYDLGSDCYMMLVTGATGAGSKADYDSVADVTNEIASNVSYINAAGTGLTSLAILSDGHLTAGNTSITGYWDAADVTFASSTITATGAIFYYSGGVDPTGKLLINYLDFGSEKTSTNGDFTVQFSASGILTLYHC